MSEPTTDLPVPHTEDHAASGTRLNWLRAAVLGANDGIVSTAGLVVGVAGATTDRTSLLVAGVAGLVAGSLSMAGGEYTSVSAQRDAQLAAIARERRELVETPDEEREELAGFYVQRGLTPTLAREVARQLTDHDALAAHAEVELGLDVDEQANPWAAAWSSMVAFFLGALLPLVAMLLPPASARLGVTVVAVAVALAATGGLAARLGGSPGGRSVVRNVVVGLLAMGVTYAVGTAVGGL